MPAGVLGGISTGADIIVRIAVKPTPSISLEQRTVDTAGMERTISVTGRHDACIVPRIGPVAEAMLALVLVDALLGQEMIRSWVHRSGKPISPGERLNERMTEQIHSHGPVIGGCTG